MQTITVVDNPPTIHCPEPVEAECGELSCPAFFLDTGVSATDDCSKVIITLEANTTDGFVTYTATDGAGNVSVETWYD